MLGVRASTCEMWAGMNIRSMTEGQEICWGSRRWQKEPSGPSTWRTPGLEKRKGRLGDHESPCAVLSSCWFGQAGGVSSSLNRSQGPHTWRGCSLPRSVCGRSSPRTYGLWDVQWGSQCGIWGVSACPVPPPRAGQPSSTASWCHGEWVFS